MSGSVATQVPSIRALARAYRVSHQALAAYPVEVLLDPLKLLEHLIRHGQRRGDLYWTLLHRWERRRIAEEIVELMS